VAGNNKKSGGSRLLVPQKWLPGFSIVIVQLKISPMHTVQALPLQAARRKLLDEIQSIFYAVYIGKKV
jgi:hypothetical protein